MFGSSNFIGCLWLVGEEGTLNWILGFLYYQVEDYDGIYDKKFRHG
jgi:hypothetical protein